MGLMMIVMITRVSVILEVMMMEIRKVRASSAIGGYYLLLPLCIFVLP